MKTFSPRETLPALGLLVLACLPTAALAGGHCAADATVSAIGGQPGWFHIQTAGGRTTARWPVQAPENSAPPAHVIRALGDRWTPTAIRRPRPTRWW